MCIRDRPWLGQGILPAERSEPASRSGEGQALASIASFVQVSPEWCDHVSGGSPGGADIAVDFSAAHALVRQFSMASPWGTAERALVSAMGEAGVSGPAWPPLWRPMPTRLPRATSA